jgi:type IV pilus assembly protein PilQ
MLIIAKFFIIILCLFFPVVDQAQSSHNTSNDFSIDLQDANLADALHILAKFMHQNIIVSHAVTDVVSLHVHHVSAQKTFNILLNTHNLISIPMGNDWFITSRNDWMQHESEQIKLQKMMESSAPLVTKVWQIHYARADDIVHMLQDSSHSLLSRHGHVRMDARTNIIYIQDTVKRLQQIAYLIKRIDIPVQQVMIEARLASVDSDYERNLGILFTTQHPTETVSHTEGMLSPTHYGLLVAKLADGSLLDVQLSAMENTGHGEVISTPRLFTANQQTAAIESGDEIPYQQESSSGGTVVVFKKAVLSLKVTPQILPDEKVLLQLHINQDKPSKLLVHGVPAISTRQISTNVLVKDGQTIVLGGIYESSQERANQSIPFLGKIPLLGLLFQQNDTIENKRELLIFVTPRVMPQAMG